MKARLEKHGDRYRVITSGITYQVMSINDHSAAKLDTLIASGGICELRLEKAEYDDYTFRGCIHGRHESPILHASAACTLEQWADDAAVDEYEKHLMDLASQQFIAFPD